MSNSLLDYWNCFVLIVEMLNTLKYSTHVANIKKKVCINEDKTSRQMAAPREEILDLQQELVLYKMVGLFLAHSHSNWSVNLDFLFFLGVPFIKG